MKVPNLMKQMREIGKHCRKNFIYSRKQLGEAKNIEDTLRGYESERRRLEAMR